MYFARAVFMRAEGRRQETKTGGYHRFEGLNWPTNPIFFASVRQAKRRADHFEIGFGHAPNDRRAFKAIT